jgi:hypothetical protein
MVSVNSPRMNDAADIGEVTKRLIETLETSRSKNRPGFELSLDGFSHHTAGRGQIQCTCP